MTTAREAVVVLEPPRYQPPCVRLLHLIVVATVLVFVSRSPEAQTAQQQGPASPPVTTVPEDSAVTELRERASAGEARAQVNLGFMYATGRGVPQDYSQGVQWFRKAAEQGFAGGQLNLGFMYATGRGVPQDYSQAVRWFQKAAEQDNASAQSNLGALYANGQGVPQDYTQAVQWYRKAAEQGNAEAQFNLGVLYYNGRGVPQDYVEADKWETLAAPRASGADQKRFADGRDEVERKMTPEQIAEAQKRGREWTEAFDRRKQ
jgi:TPR repeat protein